MFWWMTRLLPSCWQSMPWIGRMIWKSASPSPCGSFLWLQESDGDRTLLPLAEAGPDQDDSDVTLGHPADRNACQNLRAGSTDWAGSRSLLRDVLASDQGGAGETQDHRTFWLKYRVLMRNELNPESDIILKYSKISPQDRWFSWPKKPKSLDTRQESPSGA